MGSHISSRPCLWEPYLRERVTGVARGLKKNVQIYWCEDSSDIYLRHPWPSRSTGRNIEDSTEEHTGTVLLEHLQDGKNDRKVLLVEYGELLPDIQQSCR